MDVPGRFRLRGIPSAWSRKAEANMAKSPKKRVEFTAVTQVPGSVLGEGEDQEMAIGRTIALPADYADHLVSLHLAVFPRKKGRASKARPDPQHSDETGADKGAEGPDAEARAAVQARVDGLTAQMESMDEQHPDWAGLAGQLDEAREDLAGFEGS
jgi:hypothetical protein